jgi:large subunit ribosomal protein L9
MKVILQENVDNLGYVGDILDVANGYARNFLLPRGLASEANLRNVKSVEHAKRVAAHKSKQVEHGLKEEAEKLSAVSVSIPMQTGKDDKLFGSVTAKDIEAALLVEGFEVDRRKIQLPHPLKELGTSAVSIKLFRDISAQISVTVVKKGGETAGGEEGEVAEGTGDGEEPTTVEPDGSESQEEE